MDWVSILVPGAGILALFGVVGLVAVAIRQGRLIRRLETRLAERGEAAVEAPLQRIAELQARERVSSGLPPFSGQVRTFGVIALICIALAAAAGGVWYLFIRGDASSGATAARAGNVAATGTAANPPKPVDQTIVPARVPTIANKSTYSLAVFNAAGVSGAASTVGNTLTGDGWSVPLVSNEPTGATGRRESVVMFTKGKRQVAWAVAKSLGIKRAPPVDGYTPKQYGNADVIVLVGLDLANKGTSTAP